MEANQIEDSKSLSEETDRSEQSNDDVGTGRSYECVFCKRGFTTAQALGGHMNIHRKERAKNGPSTSASIASGKVDNENYASPRSYSYPPIQSYQPHYSTAPEVHASYQALFPGSGWGFRPPHTHQSEFVDNSRHLNPFGEEDWPRSLSLRIGPSHHVDDHENKKIDIESSQEDELDLELRLGHDP